MRFPISVVILVAWGFLAFLKAPSSQLPPSIAPAQGHFLGGSLERMKDELAARGTNNLIIVRHGQTLLEWYSDDSGPEKPHYTASLAKALVGGISLMLALDEGRMRVDDPAWLYIPAWKDHPEKSRIAIRHLVTHSSGIEDAEQDDIPHKELPGWKGIFWRKDPDPFTPAIHDAPVIFPPGSAYAYSNPGMAALSYAITSSLQGSDHANLHDLLKDCVMDPLGVSDKEWSIGYGRAYEVDGMNLYGSWGGGSYTARSVARIGQWMLQRGNWDGRQLVEPEWVDRAVRYAGTPLPNRPQGNPQPGSGLGWWTNFDRVWKSLPSDAFAGAGAGQQLLLVVPSLGLVLVRNGGVLTKPDEGLDFWGGIDRFIFQPLSEAMTDYSVEAGLRHEPPYPKSTSIAEIRFSDSRSIVRKAAGSDNWPVTWLDDDSMLTAYGDGWGFEPRLTAKLSLGLAKILGTATDFQGLNFRSRSIEQLGDGKRGRKASGLLAIGKRVYLWARNAQNSQLAWSDDNGSTWTWADWRLETSFGHPTFLNFGRAYEGAQDDFVYLYSPDSDSAYDPADQMVLARVPRDRVTDRSSYRFLSGFDNQGPRWSTAIEDRISVFSHPGRCYRSSVSYSPGLGRYLWVQIHPSLSPRFFGGFAIYDAPEPWGPWTTAFYTDHWDVGPGENAHLPTKWMSRDGKTAYLVFSGDDHFSVRRLEITP